jgi:ribosomal-protein-alanine N-acetyltransferase
MKMIKATNSLSDAVAAIPLDLVLHTLRCNLRMVAEDDIPFVWSAMRYPGFNDGMRWDAPADLQDLFEVQRSDHERWRVGRAYTFTVVRNSTLSRVGRIGLRAEPRQCDWNIGFWIHPEYWGQGLAVEAAQAVIAFGVHRLGAATIRAAHAAWNLQSQRVIEKLGMRLVREIPDGFEKNGKRASELEYSFEWRAAGNARLVHPYLRLSS